VGGRPVSRSWRENIQRTRALAFQTRRLAIDTRFLCLQSKEIKVAIHRERQHRRSRLREG